MRHEHKQQEYRRRIEGEPGGTQGIRDDVVDQDLLVCLVGTETMVTTETLVDDCVVEEDHPGHQQGVQHRSDEGRDEVDHRQQRT